MCVGFQTTARPCDSAVRVPWLCACLHNAMAGHDHIDWEAISLPKFAVFGTAFTVGLELGVFPLFSIATRLQYERQVSSTAGSSSLWKECTRGSLDSHPHPQTRVRFFRDAWRVFRSHSLRSTNGVAACVMVAMVLRTHITQPSRRPPHVTVV